MIMTKNELEKLLGVRGGVARVGAVNNDTPVEVFGGAAAFGIRIFLVMQPGLDLLSLSREKLLPLLTVCDANFKKRTELFEKYVALDDYEVVERLLSRKILTVGEVRRKMEWAADLGLYKTMPLLLSYTEGGSSESEEKLLARLKAELVGGKKGCMKHFRENAENFSYDRELFFLATEKDGHALSYASPVLRADKALALRALQADDGTGEPVLRYVSRRLYGEEEVLSLAFTNNPRSITCLPESERKNRETAVCALRLNGLALGYVEEAFLREKDMAAIAIKQNPAAYFLLTDESLVADEDLGVLAVGGNPELLSNEVFLRRYQKSERVMLTAIAKDVRSMRYLPVAFRGNVAFAKKVLTINKDLISDFFYNVQKDEEIARLLEE